MSEAFIIKTEEELASYGSSRGNKSIVTSSQWNELFNGAAGIGYPRVVTNEKKNYDNWITPPEAQEKRAATMNKKIKVEASECKKFFKIILVAA